LGIKGKDWEGWAGGKDGAMEKIGAREKLNP